jgi:ketosteroid isomerase-like protein
MKRLYLAAVAVLATGLASASDSKQQQEIEAIHTSHLDFIAAFNAGNLERAFGFLTDDLVALVERQPTMDKAAYRAFVTPFVAANKTEFSFEVDETVVSGEWAFERIRYSGTITPKAGGQTSRVSWRAIAIWRRLPEGWKVARYIRTPDPPPPVAQ